MCSVWSAQTGNSSTFTPQSPFLFQGFHEPLPPQKFCPSSKTEMHFPVRPASCQVAKGPFPTASKERGAFALSPRPPDQHPGRNPETTRSQLSCQSSRSKLPTTNVSFHPRSHLSRPPQGLPQRRDQGDQRRPHSGVNESITASTARPNQSAMKQGSQSYQHGFKAVMSASETGLLQNSQALGGPNSPRSSSGLPYC